jgi:hypothetical protein
MPHNSQCCVKSRRDACATFGLSWRRGAAAAHICVQIHNCLTKDCWNHYTGRNTGPASRRRSFGGTGCRVPRRADDAAKPVVENL